MTKNFWAIILGCAIICVGIIVAGNNIANHIPSIPSTLNVNSSNGQTINTYANDKYLSETEAASFLKLTDADFEKLLQSHSLDSAYTIVQGQKIFSENQLSTYVGRNISNKAPK